MGYQLLPPPPPPELPPPKLEPPPELELELLGSGRRGRTLVYVRVFSQCRQSSVTSARPVEEVVAARRVFDFAFAVLLLQLQQSM